MRQVAKGVHLVLSGLMVTESGKGDQSYAYLRQRKTGKIEGGRIVSRYDSGHLRAAMKMLSVHLTEIRTSISPSSAVELNTTYALANYATEAGLRVEEETPALDKKYNSSIQSRLTYGLYMSTETTLLTNICLVCLFQGYQLDPSGGATKQENKNDVNGTSQTGLSETVRHVFLLLLANPAWCWITWYSSTKKDVSVEGAAQATNAVRNDATKEERRANLTLINKGTDSQTDGQRDRRHCENQFRGSGGHETSTSINISGYTKGVGMKSIRILEEIFPHLRERRLVNKLEKTTLDIPVQDLNLDIPANSRPVQHESVALNYSSNKADIIFWGSCSNV
uniref:Uncharacterized protein n=1 Tax=Timema shepardi TaxID=629360 RepID=A0A7R9ASV8_TIMSH|nr:unnamed protein product [Timema shepardi]